VRRGRRGERAVFRRRRRADDGGLRRRDPRDHPARGAHGIQPRHEDAHAVTVDGADVGGQQRPEHGGKGDLARARVAGVQGLGDDVVHLPARQARGRGRRRDGAAGQARDPRFQRVEGARLLQGLEDAGVVDEVPAGACLGGKARSRGESFVFFSLFNLSKRN